MAAKSTANRTATNKMSLSNRGVHQKMRRYSRTPFIRIKWDAEPPGYAENPDYWIFLWKRGSLNFGWQTVRTCASTFQPRLICSSGSHNTNVLDPTAGNFEASYFCRLLDKFTRRAKPIRISSLLCMCVCVCVYIYTHTHTHTHTHTSARVVLRTNIDKVRLLGFRTFHLLARLQTERRTPPKTDL